MCVSQHEAGGALGAPAGAPRAKAKRSGWILPGRWILAGLLGISAAAALGKGVEGEAHQQIAALALDRFEGAKTCAACHPRAAAEVAGSLHYQFRAAAATTPGQETSRLGLATEWCGFQAAFSSNNWIRLAQPANPTLPAQPGGCVLCHVGMGAKPNPVDRLSPADYEGIDCLICHAPDYERTVVRVNGQLQVGPAPGVDVISAAQRAGRPTNDMCQRCHLSVGGGPNYKHGDAPTELTDVHLALGFQCADCHTTTAHHMAGAGDLRAVERPEVKVDCARCHTSEPHRGTNTIYNVHAYRIACQTCHIPAVAQDVSLPTVLERDWTQPTLNPETGLYGPADVLGAKLAPTYRWWNGKLSRPAAEPPGSIDDDASKIFPWKRITVHVAEDAERPGAEVSMNQEVYLVTGNLDYALAAGARDRNTDYSGRWVRGRREMFLSVQHQVGSARQALTCQDCHTPAGGRLDFAALGYPSHQVAALTSTNFLRGPSHTGRFGSRYRGSSSCILCHAGKVEEVMDSVHYTWRTPNPKVAYPGGGSHGMIDRFCGLVGSSAMVNYFADIGGQSSAVGCGKCHIGRSLPFPNPATGRYSQAQKDGIDCLICHAAPGQYDMNGDGTCTEADAQATSRTLNLDPRTGQRAWFQDRSVRAAESVGGRVSVESCQRCHEHGQGDPDYKRGTPYNASHDVHAEAGMRCTDCHAVKGHKIARGSKVSDLHAWERPEVEVDCVNCHTYRPHPEWPQNPAYVPYNEHAAFIACQTCHIPSTSGASRRVWSSTHGVTNGPEAVLPQWNSETSLFEPYSEYTPAYAALPAFRWFNGGASMLAEPLNDVGAWDFLPATKLTQGARIYPFRRTVSGMVMDGKGLASGSSFDARFTMAAAMEALQAPLKWMGFMRPEGLTEPERQALAQFPNLLNFDREHYARTGDVREAVNIGLGRLALLMSGQDPWSRSPAELSAVGANLWSGQIVGLDLPNNPADPGFNPAADPTQVTGSYINLSHGVERNTALRCLDCHSANGVMDFAMLSYSPAEAARLRGMFEKVQLVSTARIPDGLKLRWSTIPGRTYQLLSSTDLNSRGWTPIGPRERTISRWLEQVVPASVLTNAGQLFFRVEETAP